MHKLTTSLGVACLLFAAVLALWDDKRPGVPQKSFDRSTVIEATPPGSTARVFAEPSSPAERRASVEVSAKMEHASGRIPQFLVEKPVPSYEGSREAWRGQMGAQYSDLASALHVPQATADRVLDVLADSARHYQEILDNGGPADSAQLNARTAAARDVTSQERRHVLLPLLGEAGYERWLDYDESQFTRHEMRDLRRQLGETAEPLRDDQFEALIAAVHAERVRLNGEIRAYEQSASAGEEHDLRKTDAWLQHVAATRARIHASAQSILTVGQLAKLDAMMYDLRYHEAQRSRTLQPLIERRARDAINVTVSN